MRNPPICEQQMGRECRFTQLFLIYHIVQGLFFRRLWLYGVVVIPVEPRSLGATSWVLAL